MADNIIKSPFKSHRILCAI